MLSRVGVHFHDLRHANPANPVLAGELPFANSVTIVEHYAYLAMNYTNADGTSYFSDPYWTNFPHSFFRIRSQ